MMDINTTSRFLKQDGHNASFAEHLESHNDSIELLTDCCKAMVEKIEALQEEVREVNDMNQRILNELHKQDTELWQLRRAVFGYAYDSDDLMENNPGLVEFLQGAADFDKKNETKGA